MPPVFRLKCQSEANTELRTADLTSSHFGTASKSLWLCLWNVENDRFELWNISRRHTDSFINFHERRAGASVSVVTTAVMRFIPERWNAVKYLLWSWVPERSRLLHPVARSAYLHNSDTYSNGTSKKLSCRQVWAGLNVFKQVKNWLWGSLFVVSWLRSDTNCWKNRAFWAQLAVAVSCAVHQETRLSAAL